MRIGSVEQELLLSEITVFARATRDPQARQRYDTLREAIESGEVPDELAGGLATILEIGLQSGRTRRTYGADGEQVLTKLFHRTPAGAAIAGEARAVSDALAALEGQNIEGVRISALGPGTYGLAIDTDRCQINVRLSRGGVSVENVAVGI